AKHVDTATFQARLFDSTSAAAITFPVAVSRCTSAEGVIASWIGRSAEPSFGPAAVGDVPPVPAPPHAAIASAAANAHPSGPRKVLTMNPLPACERVPIICG